MSPGSRTKSRYSKQSPGQGLIDAILIRRSMSEAQRPAGQKLWQSSTWEKGLGIGDGASAFSVREFLRWAVQIPGVCYSQSSEVCRGILPWLRCEQKYQVSHLCPLRVQGSIDMHFCPWPRKYCGL